MVKISYRPRGIMMQMSVETMRLYRMCLEQPFVDAGEYWQTVSPSLTSAGPCAYDKTSSPAPSAATHSSRVPKHL